MDTGSGNNDRARVDALLDALLDLDEGEARDVRLREVGVDDPQLEDQLRSLLHFAQDPDVGPLDKGLCEFWSGVLTESQGTESAGSMPERVGPWRLQRELGRGGMGTVYLGQRADGEFEQAAAIKLVNAGESDQRIIRRFELERQILAGLRHPNIAQLLDGGRTTDGHPYFAMEYVQGRPIGEFCDAERLTIRERLDLFRQICKAVEHAHRRLVIHRDLKPSNIVVTDDVQVKLLDFGIARLLGPHPGGAAPLTSTVRMLTPGYASPEQIQGAAITTASDVYQLGLLLYELLTGHRAHRLKAQTLSEFERVVCEQEPARPSTLVTSDQATPSAAWARRTQPAALARKLHGDLDNIVLFALRKEPERRYASVSQLRDDIERHLQSLPVSARPSTIAYRAGKFLRRHALATAAAVAFLVLLLGYSATTTIQSRQIRRERDRAEVAANRARQVTDFLVGIFEAADPYRHRGDELTAKELLEAGAEAAKSDLQDQPEVLSEMLLVLGSVSNTLGAYERADELLTEGLTLASTLHPEPHPDVARAQILVSRVLNAREEHDRAFEVAQTALATYRQLHDGDLHADVAEGLSAVGTAELYRGHLEAAEHLFREEVTLREALGVDDAHLASALNDLGTAAQRLSDDRAAEGHHRRALALRRLLFPPEHPDVSESLNNLAVTLRKQQRLEEAEPLYREALEIRRRVFGDRHLRVANTLNNLGELHRRQRRFEDAEAAHREALSIRVEVLGETHTNVGFSLHNLGVLYRDSGRPELAEQYLTQAMALFRTNLPPGHHVLAYSTMALGRLYVSQDRLLAAAALLEETVIIRQAALGDEHALTAEGRLALGLCRAAEGRPEEALAELQSGFATLEALDEEGAEDLVGEARAVLAQLQSAA